MYIYYEHNNKQSFSISTTFTLAATWEEQNSFLVKSFASYTSAEQPPRRQRRKDQKDLLQHRRNKREFKIN